MLCDISASWVDSNITMASVGGYRGRQCISQVSLGLETQACDKQLTCVNHYSSICDVFEMRR